MHPAPSSDKSFFNYRSMLFPASCKPPAVCMRRGMQRVCAPSRFRRLIHDGGEGGGDIFGIRPWETMNYGFSLSLLSCLLEVQAAMSPMSDKYPSYSSPTKDSMAVKFHIFIHFKSYPYAGLKSPLGQCFSTAGPRPGTGPWHQLYRATRGSPASCHFSFLRIFHE